MEALGHPGTDQPAHHQGAVDLPAAVVELVAARVETVSSARSRSALEPTAAVPVGPFVLGVTGGAGAGKSTLAQQLARRLAALAFEPRVEVVATDGFLLSNAELADRGILGRKGFPESYDHERLVEFLGALKAGRAPLTVPLYSHLRYDVIENEHQVVRGPDVLVLEGLHLLAPAPRSDRDRSLRAVRDFVDWCVYLDADAQDLRRWFLHRFEMLREEAADDPDVHPYFQLDDEDSMALADAAWKHVNEPNLVQHILPTRHRADLVVVMGPDRCVRKIVVPAR